MLEGLFVSAHNNGPVTRGLKATREKEKATSFGNCSETGMAAKNTTTRIRTGVRVDSKNQFGRSLSVLGTLKRVCEGKQCKIREMHVSLRIQYRPRHPSISASQAADDKCGPAHVLAPGNCDMLYVLSQFDVAELVHIGVSRLWAACTPDLPQFLTAALGRLKDSVTLVNKTAAL